MAVIRTIYCRKCKRNKEVSVPHGKFPTICPQCEKEEKLADKDKLLNELAQMPIEERVARLEELLYEHLLSRHYQGPTMFG